MLTFKEIAPLQAYIANYSGVRPIGFVPTMGALHDGHISLIMNSKKNGDLTVCSIYVNPTQFDNPRDLEKYPRNIEKDIEKLKNAQCDILFCPDNDAIYPSDALTSLNFGYLETIMEGKYRKGHFKGVGLVVSKLFHIVAPDIAYFGQKDYQQFLVIRQLVKDLFFNIKLVCVPTSREADGLAMSSRNARLQSKDRETAASFYEALTLAKSILLSEKSLAQAKKTVKSFFSTIKGAHLEYFEIRDADTLTHIEDSSCHKEVVLCIAGYVGTVRLIDNIIVELNK